MGKIEKEPLKEAPIRAEIVQNLNSLISSKNRNEKNRKMTINNLRQRLSLMMSEMDTVEEFR